MLYIYNKSNDPYFNLAAEEYVLNNIDDEVFMLWVNNDVIVVGNNQNTMAEINYDYVKQNNIAVVRRLTGGGAVFHDKGNLNYTFITNKQQNNDKTLDFEYFGNIIVGALATLGLDAQLSGRNDLVIKDKKFSGTAQTVQKGKVLHHGTLMLNIVIDKLSNALNVSPEKIKGKGIKSVKSRVTNINQHLDTPITIKQLIAAISNYISNQYLDIKNYEFTKQDIEEIQKLANEKYSTWQWVYGSSPEYNFKKDTKIGAGNIQVRIQVKKGIIQSVRLFGDYFGTHPSQHLEDILIGCQHSAEALEERLKDVNINDYVFSASKQDLIKALI